MQIRQILKDTNLCFLSFKFFRNIAETPTVKKIAGCVRGGVGSFYFCHYQAMPTEIDL